MDNNDVIARRYTDEKYLSKTGLQQEMGTGLVDPFWNAIRAYRKDFEVGLPFHGIGRSPLHYVETTTIRERLSSFSKRLDLFLDKLANLLAGSDGRSIRSMLLYQCLKAIDIDGNFQMADRSIKALLSGTYDEDQPFHEPLINYHAYLRSLFSEGSGDLKSEDFLAHSYGIIRGEGDDLTEFYRNRELDSSVSKIRFLRDAVYPSAPLNEVDSLMGAFLPYVDSSDATPFVKAVFSLYFLTYVRPFDADYNGMMAALLFKKEYADGCKKPAAYYFPFERLLIAGASLEPNARSALSVGEGKKREQLKKEVQRSGDLTYVLFDALDSIAKLIDEIDDAVNSIRLEALREEHRMPEEEKAAIKESGAFYREVKRQETKAETPLAPSPVLDKAEAQPVAVRPDRADVAPRFHKEEVELPPVAPVTPISVEEENAAEPPSIEEAETEAPAEERKEEPITSASPFSSEEGEAEEEEEEEAADTPADEAKAEKKPSVAPKRIIDPSELAGTKSLSLEPQRLSEREAKEYVLYLLETNPSLNKKQASFLASHCTMGRYYTIQNFKTYAKVAYETARTSMDKLASLGYYEKLQVKNKFVYTPVLKGRSKANG